MKTIGRGMTVEFNMDNAVFERSPQFEVVRILEEIVARVYAGEKGAKIFDLDGNVIGEWGVII
jgi:hypothetical protein